MTVTVPAQGPARVPAADRWSSLRDLLDQQRADCLSQRELALSEAATSVPDPVAVDRAARLLAAVGEIDVALNRIAEGTYGVCVHCGADIPQERLELRPAAAGCVACLASAR